MNLTELDEPIRREILKRVEWPAELAPLANGAFVVDSSAMDPQTLWERTPPRDFYCLKWGGTDSGSQQSFRKTALDLSAKGLPIGCWVTAPDFPNPVDMAQAVLAASIMVADRPLRFCVFEIESYFKSNGDHGDGFWRAEALVNAWADLLRPLPAGIISYGKADLAIDLDTFVLAGWPVWAECYQDFKPGDELSYGNEPAWWPPGITTIKPVVHTLHPAKDQSIYRPEGLDP